VNNAPTAYTELPVERRCGFCAKPLAIITNSNKRYCDKKCRSAASSARYRKTHSTTYTISDKYCELSDCNNLITIQRLQHGAKYCSKLCYRKANATAKVITDAQYRRTRRQLQRFEREKRINNETMELLRELLANADSALKSPLLEANSLREQNLRLEETLIEASGDAAELSHALLVVTKRTASILPKHLNDLANKWHPSDWEVA